MHPDDRVRVQGVIGAAADALRPWAHHLRPVHDGDATGPTASPSAVDPATAIAGLSLLLSVLTFWQTERHHREEVSRLDGEADERRAALRDDVANLRVSGDRVAEELASVAPEDLAAARAAIAGDPVVRTDVAALLARAGVPVTDVAAALDRLSTATN